MGNRRASFLSGVPRWNDSKEGKTEEGGGEEGFSALPRKRREEGVAGPGGHERPCYRNDGNVVYSTMLLPPPLLLLLP